MRPTVILTLLVATAMLLCCVDGNSPRRDYTPKFKAGNRNPLLHDPHGHSWTSRDIRRNYQASAQRRGDSTQDRGGSQLSTRPRVRVDSRPTTDDERAQNRFSNETDSSRPAHGDPLPREDTRRPKQQQGRMSAGHTSPGERRHGGDPSRPRLESGRRPWDYPDRRENHRRPPTRSSENVPNRPETGERDRDAMNERDLDQSRRGDRSHHSDRRHHSDRGHHSDRRRPGDRSGGRPEHHRHGHHPRGMDHPPHHGRPDERHGSRGDQTGPDGPRHHPRSDWIGGSHRHSHKYGGHSSSSEEERSERTYETAPYDVVCTSPDGYELRQYEEAVWATTMVNCSSHSCTKKWFRRLFHYISGENDQDVKIPMSKPVRQRMVRRQDVGSVCMVAASFYLPRVFWDDPPAPRDQEVFIERMSPLVFTSNFSGWAENRVISRHYDTLRRRLEQEGHSIVDDDFAVQSYNPPWEIFNRHNEVLIEADTDAGTPSCAPSAQPGQLDDTQDGDTTGGGLEMEQPGLEVRRHHSHDHPVRPFSRPDNFRHHPQSGGRSGSHHPHRHGGHGSSSEEEERGEHRHESAPYDVVCASPEGYELRQYEEAVWATTLVNCSSSGCKKDYFYRLLGYISGGNDQDIEIPMSMPVRRRMLKIQDSEDSNGVVMMAGSFYLPRQFWENTPVPRDPEVLIERISPLAFTSNFSGWAEEGAMLQHYDTLRELLEQEGHPIDDEDFVVQSYDPPWQQDNRHNEVLIEADLGTATCGPHGVERPGTEIHSYHSHNHPAKPSFHSDSRRQHRHGGHRHGSSSEEEERGEHRHESAPYDVVCTSPEGYELRQYEEAVWATTLVNCSSPGCKKDYFHRLFGYISGGNDQDIEIPMSKPVRRRMLKIQDSEDSNGVVMMAGSFYLPREFWDNTPVPRDPEVFIERISPLVFTSNFSGWAEEGAVSQHYDTLRELLEQEGHPIDEEEFVVQSYDPPWQEDDRHNEVLIKADLGTATCGPHGVERPGTEIHSYHGHNHPAKPSFHSGSRRHHRHGEHGSSSEEEGRGEHRHESAPYDVVCTSPEGYEIRQYEEAVWATTLVNCSSPGCKKDYFHKLFGYISGGNDQDVEIPMSTPVRKRMVKIEDGAEDSNRVVMVAGSFYLPRSFWDNPPVPRDREVFIERISPLVFTSNFSGWAEERTMLRHYDTLHELLEQEGHPIADEDFVVQSYDPPWKVINRHNEILIEADPDTGTPTCVPQTAEEPPNGIRQCRDHECPQYSESERLSEAVVIREVGSGVYATKKSTTCNLTNVFAETYMPLRKYFTGMNVEGVTIPATTPILQLAVRPDRSDSPCTFTYRSSFYLPEEYQTSPPTPLEESIVISETDRMPYFVMTFHENPTPLIAFEKYNELKSLVTEAGQCYQPGEFRLAFYDAPFRPLPHRYEMWIPVDEGCNDVGEEDFDLIPIDGDGNVILPPMNDDPLPQGNP